MKKNQVFSKGVCKKYEISFKEIWVICQEICVEILKKV